MAWYDQSVGNQEICALQVAVIKGKAGVFTSLFHYHRMFESMGIRTACLYRGPATARLEEAGVGLLPAPTSLTTPFFRILPSFSETRVLVSDAFDGRTPDLVMVHSDLALENIRTLFPKTTIFTRCHTDKTKRKRRADVVVTLNLDQHERVSAELSSYQPIVRMLGHPFCGRNEAIAMPKGPLRLNFCARFVPDKDPLTLVRALALIAPEKRPVVRFIGDGPMAQEIKDTSERLEVSASFVPWQDNPFQNFTTGDVLVLPSRWEGLPWLLLEAQKLGVSSLVSDIPGNRLAVNDGETGVLFPVGDSAALASRIIEMIETPSDLYARAKQGASCFDSRFGPAAFWDGLKAAAKEFYA